MIKRAFIFYLLFFISFFSFPKAKAEGRFSATVTDISGEVWILKQGERYWLPVELDTPLEQSDRIRTGATSFAEILFDNGSVIKIEENTDIYLKELSADSDTKNIISKIFLKIGTLLSNISRFVHKSSRFSVFTNTMIAGVRGTEFVVTASDEKTDVGVFSGELEVGSVDPQGNLIKGTQVTVREGFQSTVFKSKRPLRPFKMKKRFIAFGKKIQLLRKRAIEHRRNLKNIIKRRMEQKIRIFNRWKKLKKLKMEGLKQKKQKRLRRLRRRRRR